MVAHFRGPECSLRLTIGGKFVQSDWFPSLVMLLGKPAERLQAFGRIPRAAWIVTCFGEIPWRVRGRKRRGTKWHRFRLRPRTLRVAYLQASGPPFRSVTWVDPGLPDSAVLPIRRRRRSKLAGWGTTSRPSVGPQIPGLLLIVSGRPALIHVRGARVREIGAVNRRPLPAQQSDAEGSVS
jgi:hypothetical protein